MNVRTVDVSAYADAVRRALADLGPDQVDDLTDGLEADLAEAMADDRHARHGATLLEQFGPPEQYAAELRSAAGIELPSEPSGSHRPHPVRWARRLVATIASRLDATPWWPPVRDFMVSLRSAWWLLRGWVAYQVAVAVVGGTGRWLPTTLRGWLALAVLLGLSVQWGRGRLRLPGGWNAVPLVLSAAAAVAVLPTVGWVLDHSVRLVVVQTAPTLVQGPGGNAPAYGVIVDAMAVSNLFVYDQAGNPVPDAQVYDDRGRPVITTEDRGQSPYWYFGATKPWYLVGATEVGGATRWNVYPLRGGPVSSFDRTGTGVVPTPGATLAAPPWPFAKAPAISTPPAGTTPSGAAPTAGTSAPSSSTAGPGAGPTADAGMTATP